MNVPVQGLAGMSPDDESAFLRSLVADAVNILLQNRDPHSNAPANFVQGAASALLIHHS
jgi:hypothetical protein